MNARDKKHNEAIMHCYTELYKNSEPAADFQQLMDNATINEWGQKEIPFRDHEIDEKLADQIIEETIKKYKIKNWYARSFKTSILLGCSPKYKKNY